jgi:hypothetical protein
MNIRELLVCRRQVSSIPIGQWRVLGIFRSRSSKRRNVMPKAVGFYWTLPVPWAGFTALPQDVEAAAKASRTIRYQREAVRREVETSKWELVDEVVFLELAPDRGSAFIASALGKAVASCRRHDALLLLVDFRQVHGWRAHAPFGEAIRALGIKPISVPLPETLPLDGEMFDPFAHFADWRARQQQWTAERPQRQAAMAARASALRTEGRTHAEIAALLNDAAIPSASGKPHTAESVRKALKAASPE